MSAIVEFQKRLLASKKARTDFASDPKKFLDELGVKLPEGISVPARIDPDVIERSVKSIADNLAEERITVDSLSAGNSTDVIRTIEELVPARTRDLVAARAVHSRVADAGDNATVAVVGAVVAAVVAVPVATFGARDEAVSRINPAFGVERVTRGAGGVTVHGPNGLRVEGLSVNEVATLLKNIR